MTALLTQQFATQKAQFLAAHTVLGSDFAGYGVTNGAGQALASVNHAPTPANLGINANLHCFTVQPDHPHVPATCYFDVNAGGIAQYKIKFEKNGSRGWKPAFYLPFKENLIVGMELSDRANFFFTANLSGCSVYVERDTITNRLRVYHANGMRLTQHGGDQGAQDYMDRLYMAARPANSQLISRCDPALYNRQVLVYMNRKRAKEYQNVSTLGFTTVYGFRTGPDQWSFYFQTCAQFNYTQPGLTPSFGAAAWNAPLSTVGSLLTWNPWPGTVAPVNKNKPLACMEVSRFPETLHLDL
ncbi:hypothetical protein DRW03_03445 [Corallococcus sp. H22C18031201]|uniref:hypothetical protein n=1 Tax=Citreicoccus inhibens TaxID=2849499 RepID=UPI000E7133BC|nr:hypothetical protein [Citreicoccus inhibens]MBU8899584.1 hypothetical protein [Citreicoccus inhibens]RJS27433.1 hypothetical protein DRW03_03445 [Corallococcus sp. H22C18031201]